MQIEIGIVLAIIGCFVGVSGFMAGERRQSKIDGEWKGAINTKLEALPSIQKDLHSIRAELVAIVEDSKRETVAALSLIRDEVGEISVRVTKAEIDLENVHKRLDGLDRRRQ